MLFATFTSLFIQSAAYAFTAMPCINRNSNQRFGDLITPVAIIGEPDRLTEDEFAQANKMKLSDVQNRYAATGTLKCKNFQLSADLVMVDDLIVTSAHIFRDRKTCKKVEDPKNCKFTVKVGNQEQTSQLDSVIAQGFTGCPKKPSDDWAIVRLKKKIKGVTPYAVDANEEIDAKQGITSVSALNPDLFRGKVHLPMETKTIGRCTSSFIYRVAREASLFSSDCDGAEGQSGGAVLKDDFNGPPVLLGIHQAVSETEEQLKDALNATVPHANEADLDEEKWANRHVALRGKFLSSLLKAVQN